MYNSLSYKTKQFFWLLIKLSIVIGCGYFIYLKLIENEQIRFNDFYKNLIKNNLFSTENTLILLILTFFNHFFEILKWKYLASFCKKTEFKNAAIQSFASLTASLITPNRIGEYGAKALYFEKSLRKQIVGLNLVGNFYQMFATLFFGIIGFIYFVIQHQIEIDFYKIFQFIIFALFLIFALFFVAKNFKFKGNTIEKAKNFINSIPLQLNIKTGLISILRFVIFSHQFYFLLMIFKVDISYVDAISAITSVYFIASIVPMLSLFDVVLKGTVAVWIFTFLNIDALTVLSITTIMWIFNFVIPAIIGSYFVLIFKPNFTK